MSHTDTIRRAVDAMNAGDLDTYMQLYGEDLALHGYPPGVEDKASLTGFYRAFMTGFPDLRIHLEEFVVEGDRLGGRFRATGTHDGVFMGIAPTGRSIDVPGLTIMHFAGGVVVERWNQLDDVALLTQIGVMPQAPA